ncbi:LuxR family transcriptional regulator [Rhodococcus sp. X156]|uniref:LuxR family transcriptional regulator n=1 Tax=Rhodococcus sp. X156 TaxID=2499145 RepID=UPI001F49B741|nr:LuxR family transcriptional regulator [Rhodococcus sp. X156]
MMLTSAPPPAPAVDRGPAGPCRESLLTRPALSKREIEVVLAWLRSDSKITACRRLYISVGTMNTHLSRVRAKYADVGRPAPTKAALLARALQDNLTTLEEW